MGIFDRLRKWRKTREPNTASEETFVLADSSLKFYEEGLRKASEVEAIKDVGDLFGVIAHELGHNFDEFPGVREKIYKTVREEHGVVPLPEDYAKRGEHEFVADLMALLFYSAMGQNKKIEAYGKMRGLRRELYEAFKV